MVEKQRTPTGSAYTGLDVVFRLSWTETGEKQEPKPADFPHTRRRESTYPALSLKDSFKECYVGLKPFIDNGPDELWSPIFYSPVCEIQGI